MLNRLQALPIIFLFGSVLSMAQPYSIAMQVFAANGGSGEQGNFQVSWTVGETVIQTLSANDYILTQGFHQPDIFTPVSTWNLDARSLHLALFPNPVSDFLSITFIEEASGSISVTACDITGRPVLPLTVLTDHRNTRIDMHDWPAGLYMFQVFDAVSRSGAVYRVVRL